MSPRVKWAEGVQSGLFLYFFLARSFWFGSILLQELFFGASQACVSLEHPNPLGSPLHLPLGRQPIVVVSGGWSLTDAGYVDEADSPGPAEVVLASFVFFPLMRSFSYSMRRGLTPLMRSFSFKPFSLGGLRAVPMGFPTWQERRFALAFEDGAVLEVWLGRALKASDSLCFLRLCLVIILALISKRPS